MWSMVAQRLTQITPPAATPNQLWQRVEDAWSAVPQEHIQSFFESMPGLVAAVISNNGGYSGKRPGLSLSLPCDRQSNTHLSRLASGHLRNLTFSGGNKRFPICSKGQLEQASPQLILKCLVPDWGDIRDSPLLESDFIKVNGFTGLI
ncbi:ester hydrolase C11orf54 [Trichonephila clavipes]|nr:ester hydrolase C11orf54 [Trichonephila clavipes]